MLLAVANSELGGEDAFLEMPDTRLGKDAHAVVKCINGSG